MDFKFPEDFKKDMKKINGDTPSNYVFHTENGTERIFGGLFSFNKEDKETGYIVTYNNSEVIRSRGNFVAIAIDPFGNFIGYDRNNNDIMFLNHEIEIDNLEKVANSWTELKNKL